MVDSGAAACQKSGDGAFRFARGEQLDFGLSEWERSDVGPVGGFNGIRLEGKHVAIEREGCLEIGDGNPNMRNPGAIRHAIPPSMYRIGINP